jgi:Protein of unknown function (DUF2699).
VIGPFDPGHDLDAQLVAAGPGTTVEDVLLQQGEERFHRGIVTCCADSAHRSDHAVTVQSMDETPGTKLRSTVAVNHASGDVTAPGDRIIEGIDGQSGLHPGVDRIAHDAVGVHVLDRTEVDLPLARPMLGDVRQPQLVGGGRSEVALHEIVVNGRPGLRALAAALLAERRPPAVIPADRPRRPLRHRLACRTGFVDEEPVTELGVVAVGVKERIGAVGSGEFRIGDRTVEPPVVRLASELQYPTRHHDGDPVGGELCHERVEPFPGRFAWDK